MFDESEDVTQTELTVKCCEVGDVNVDDAKWAVEASLPIWV